MHILFWGSAIWFLFSAPLLGLVSLISARCRVLSLLILPSGCGSSGRGRLALWGSSVRAAVPGSGRCRLAWRGVPRPRCPSLLWPWLGRCCRGSARRVVFCSSRRDGAGGYRHAYFGYQKFFVTFFHRFQHYINHYFHLTAEKNYVTITLQVGRVLAYTTYIRYTGRCPFISYLAVGCSTHPAAFFRAP